MALSFRKNNKLHRNSIAVIVLAIVTSVAVWLVGEMTSRKVVEMQQLWNQHSDQSNRISSRLHQLQQTIGYGGFIHHFKNWVLRRDPKYPRRINDQIVQIRQIIYSYRNLPGVTTGELAALEQVELVFENYFSKFQQTLQPDKLQLSAEEFDKIVRTDDSPALRAIAILARASGARNALHDAATRRAMNDALFYVKLRYLLVLVVLVTAILVILLLVRLVRGNDALTQAERRISRIVETVPVAILLLNESGRIVRGNRRAVELLGYEESALVDLMIGDIVPNRMERKYGDVMGAFSDSINHPKKTISHEMEVITNDAQFIAVDASFVYIESDDETTVVVSLYDLTERKTVERAVYDRERAQAENKAKSTFLAKMSHELRTPLTAIIGLLYLLIRDNYPKRLRDQLMKIDSAAHNLLNIINDILDYSKIEAGKLKLEQTPFNLEEVIDNVANVTAIGVKDKDIELLFTLNSDVPTQLVGDPSRLSQVLINVVNNAIKFTSEGEVLVTISQLHGTEEYCSIVFSVVDTGIGMNQETLGSLFKPFEQADSSTTRLFGGTGLGLTIVHQLVTLMGGSVSINSREGAGTSCSIEVRFNLSIENVDHQDYDRSAFNKLNILLIDDNKHAIGAMEEILKRFGSQLTTSSNAEEGYSIWRGALERGDAFGVVFIDWQLPGIDGISTAQRIKEEDPDANVVLVVTPYEREILRKQNLDNHLDEILVKPITPSHLFDSVVRSIHSCDVPLDDSQNPANDHEGRLNGLQLLLVEDNIINQEVAGSILERANAVVTIASNGEEALTILDGSENEFDAVLMDIRMPVMDGFEATKRIRQNPQWQELPIIAMTANATVQDREQCLSVGMDDHIPKPIDPENLYQVIHAWTVEQNRDSEKIDEETSQPLAMPLARSGKH